MSNINVAYFIDFNGRFGDILFEPASFIQISTADVILAILNWIYFT